MSEDDSRFYSEWGLGRGVARDSLDLLVHYGLAEEELGDDGDMAWRITNNGWRRMIGRRYEGILETPTARAPLRVWKWPIDF